LKADLDLKIIFYADAGYEMAKDTIEKHIFPVKTAFLGGYQMKKVFLEYARRGFLRDLLYNNITNVKDIRNLQEQLNIKTLPNTVMVIAIDNYHSITKRKSEIQKQNLRLKVLKNIEEASIKFDAYGINLGEDLYAVLFYIDSSEIEQVDKTMYLAKILKDYIERKTGTSVSIGIGRVYKNISDLYLSYKEALSACNHKFFLGKSQVIHIENVVPFSNGIELLFIEVETQLLVKILSCDKEGAFQTLDKFFSKALEGRFIKPIIIKTRLIEIVTSLVKAGLETGAKQDELEILNSNYVQEVLKSDTIMDLRNKMKEVISGVIEKIVRGRKRMNLEIFEKAIEYINDNFNKKITLENVSEHLYVSPYHFSHGFKKFTGMSFIEYLTRIRIREAKKLLLTTDLNISAVSKRVGYDDPNYFGRVFKKIEGIPPSEFKVSKINDYML
jgi:two-component system response regulator YesN